METKIIPAKELLIICLIIGVLVCGALTLINDPELWDMFSFPKYRNQTFIKY